MLQKQVHGRLGNQFFQYASIKGIMKANGIEEKIGFCFNNISKFGFKNELNDFKIDNSLIEINKIDLNIIQKCFVTIIKITEKIMEIIINNKNKYVEKKNKLQITVAPFFQRFGIYNISNGYYEFKISKVKNKIFIGGFESPKYFENIKDEIKKEFTPQYDRKPENEKLYSIIENSNSVCVTIRRGDFLSKEFKKQHYVCTPEFFYKGIEYMQKNIEQPQFIVFSDDIKWVKENMNFPKNTVFEKGDDPVWEKLRLMYSCKHFIISNSTFSWWAQYLSRNEEKIVVAPARWKNEGYINKDIYDEKWILIDV